MPISIGAGVAFGVGPAGTTLVGGPPYSYSVSYLVVAGGGGNYTPPAGGGTGVIAFAYAGNARGTGGTISTLNGYTVHIFNSSGTFSP
jgi:hypothetical protein